MFVITLYLVTISRTGVCLAGGATQPGGFDTVKIMSLSTMNTSETATVGRESQMVWIDR